LDNLNDTIIDIALFQNRKTPEQKVYVPDVLEMTEDDLPPAAA